MREQEQGALTECVYCNDIYPELLTEGDCPVCHNARMIFKPARMMDRETAQEEVLQRFIPEAGEISVQIQKERLIELLFLIKIYSFDLKQAIMDKIRKLEA